MPHERFTHLQTEGLLRVTALEMMQVFPQKPGKVENRGTLYDLSNNLKKTCRKLLTFCDATSGLFRRNSILMRCRYPDLDHASDWLCLEANLLKPLRTGISALTR